MASNGVATRVGKAYSPQTKGKVEWTVGFVKKSFWAGVSFTDIDDLPSPARTRGASASIHGCIGPPTNAPESAENGNRFPRCLKLLPGNASPPKNGRVSWDGYLSYDGVWYGLPSQPPVAGSVVQVRERHGLLSVWSQGHLLIELAKRAHSQEIVTHPDQFRGIAPAASRRAQVIPLGHQRPVPHVLTRPLSEYDQLCGVE